MHLGDRVRRLRKERGMTAADLAVRLSISYSSMRVMECGRYQPSLRVFRALVEALALSDVEIRHLLAAVTVRRGTLPCEEA